MRRQGKQVIQWIRDLAQRSLDEGRAVLIDGRWRDHDTEERFRDLNKDATTGELFEWLHDSLGGLWGTATPDLKQSIPEWMKYNDTAVYDCLLSDVMMRQAIQSYVADVEEEEREEKGPVDHPSEDEGATTAVPLTTTQEEEDEADYLCLLYTSPSPRYRQKSRMPSSA